jgi:hypothetical protein
MTWPRQNGNPAGGEAVGELNEIRVDRGVLVVRIVVQHEPVVLVGMQEALPPSGRAHDDQREADRRRPPALLGHAGDRVRGDHRRGGIVQPGQGALHGDAVLAVPHQRCGKPGLLRPG